MSAKFKHSIVVTPAHLFTNSLSQVFFFCDLLLKSDPIFQSQWAVVSKATHFRTCSRWSNHGGWVVVGEGIRLGGGFNYNTQNTLAMQILHLTCKWKPLQLIWKVEVEGGWKVSSQMLYDGGLWVVQFFLFLFGLLKKKKKQASLISASV